jgi:probable phosphomutase (TIGR03848 family)
VFVPGAVCSRTADFRLIIADMTRFLLIRHALVDGYGTHLAGRGPGVRLNGRGRAQAAALAARLARLPLAAVYSSPLERAVETAQALAGPHCIDVAVDDAFLELDFGTWTGVSIAQIADDPQFRRFNTFRSGTQVPSGEFMLQAQARVVLGLDRLRVHHADQQVAIVSHGDMIRAAIAYYAGIHLDMFQRIEISPCSISVVDIDEEHVRIVCINDTDGVEYVS